MAVSGSKNFAVTRADINEAAFRKLGIFDRGENLSGDDTNAANLALNLMVKEWITEGADIFLRTESTLFLQPDTNSYALSTDEITDSYNETVRRLKDLRRDASNDALDRLPNDGQMPGFDTEYSWPTPGGS